MSTVGSKSGFRSILKAAVIVGCAASISFGFARALDAVSWSWIYQNQFSFVPAHWFRSQLTEASTDAAETCVLLGVSVTREGFDSDQLSSEVPGVRFVNLATTGGYSPMDVLDIESRILAQAGGKYRCIIVGMNNFYFRQFDSKAYELVKTDYLSQVPIELLGAARVWAGGSSKLSIVSRLMIPFGRNSVIAQRWWRFGLYNLRKSVSPDLTNAAAYEVEPNEFKPAVQFQYLGLPSIFEHNVDRARQEIVDHQLDLPTSYSDPVPPKVFRQTIDRLSSLSDHVMIVTVPLSSVYQSVEKVSKYASDAARLGVKNAVFLRCSVGGDDERLLFYDTSHLNAEGRKRLSSNLSPQLRFLLNGNSALPPNSGCATY
jgi:hypothetical protein